MTQGCLFAYDMHQNPTAFVWKNRQLQVHSWKDTAVSWVLVIPQKEDARCFKHHWTTLGYRIKKVVVLETMLEHALQRFSFQRGKSIFFTLGDTMTHWVISGRKILEKTQETCERLFETDQCLTLRRLHGKRGMNLSRMVLNNNETLSWHNSHYWVGRYMFDPVHRAMTGLMWGVSSLTVVWGALCVGTYTLNQKSLPLSTRPAPSWERIYREKIKQNRRLFTLLNRLGDVCPKKIYLQSVDVNPAKVRITFSSHKTADVFDIQQSLTTNLPTLRIISSPEEGNVHETYYAHAKHSSLWVVETSSPLGLPSFMRSFSL